MTPPLFKRFLGRRTRPLVTFGIVILFPILPIYLIFSVFPIFYNFYISLYQWGGVLPTRPFVGLQNYLNNFQDPVFWQIMRNTVIYSFFMLLGIVFSLFLALALNMVTRKFRSFYLLCYFIPVVSSIVAVCLIWNFIYDPTYGVANYMLSLIGLPSQGWLRDPRIALISICILMIWKTMGYNGVIFLAGLQSLPGQLYEAAEVDGANLIQRFFYVTLPLLRPVALFVLITTTISSFQVFAPVWTITQGRQGIPGGPANSTNVIGLSIFLNAFRDFRMGYASAQAVILFFIILTLVIMQYKFLGKKWEY